MNQTILQTLVSQSPKIDLDEFLVNFEGKVFNGKKGFKAALKHIKAGQGECVVIFHNWWVILKNEADWINCLKLQEFMNDWKGA